MIYITKNYKAEQIKEIFIYMLTRILEVLTCLNDNSVDKSYK